MKLKQNAHADALCPVCALDGTVTKLEMPVHTIELVCQNGHAFNTQQLSLLASQYERPLER